MENENLFQSELRLFQKVLGDIQGKRVLSVGCGSGLFESMIDCSGIEGIEPSRDMGAIAEKRGVKRVTLQWMLRPSYAKRYLSPPKRVPKRQCLTLTRLDDDEDADEDA